MLPPVALHHLDKSTTYTTFHPVIQKLHNNPRHGSAWMDGFEWIWVVPKSLTG